MEARNLTKHYPVKKGFLQRVVGTVRAVDDVSFILNSGETLSLVGESGAGKTTTANMLFLLERLTSGSIYFKGRDLQSFSSAQIQSDYRPNVQAVQQNPWSSMNPRMRVRSIVGEPLIVNRKMSKKQVKEQVVELLELVGLKSDHADFYPHEFSGGQRQRVAVARALALHPSLVILDEPVSALDVSIRAQIMNLLWDLQEQYKLSYLVIAHNLATVRYLSHSVAIMYLGQIVEYGQGETMFQNPLHPYTKALISASLLAMPDEAEEQHEQIILSGEMPSPLNPPQGCRFHTRCPNIMDICSREEPKMITKGSQQVKCHLYR